MGALPTFNWLFAVAGGALILGLAIAYGLMQSRRRSRRDDQVAEQATHDIYKRDGR